MAVTPRKKPATKKPAPLTLKGSKLEDFLPLLPAEKKLRQCAANGEDCEVDGFSGERPEKATDHNTIRAEFLRYMILGGCEKSPINHQGIIIAGAFIQCAAKHNSLDLQSVSIHHDIELAACNISGSINLIGATIKSLALSGTSIRKLDGGRLKSSGGIILRRGFLAYDHVTFIDAKIFGELGLSNAKLLGQPYAISCDRADINSSVFLNDGFKAEGKVDFLGARITGDINCTDGQFESGLNLQNATIKENLWLAGQFSANKTISLRNARIEGNLHCESGVFNDPNNAIIANRAKIDGDVDLENMRAKGTIALTGTEIGGDFTPQGAVLEGIPALQLRNTKIGGTLIWRSLKHVNGEVDFSGASCKTINTDGDSWMRKRETYNEKRAKEDAEPEKTDEPQAKKIEYNTKLDNFTFEGFSNLPDNCQSSFWIEWLNQQPQEHLEKNFKPRPWEQLAVVLDTMGYQEEARDIRIEKQKLQTKFMRNHEAPSFTWAYLWHLLQYVYRLLFWGPVVSYGYRPGKALVWLFALILTGSVIYNEAAKRGIMTPTHPLIYKEARAGGSIPAGCAENWVIFPNDNCASAMPSEYSEFQPLVYAIDVALPVVNLRMESDWAPRVVFIDGTRDNFGWWVRTFEWLLIASGWILSLLFVSAVGSSIRK